VETDTTQSQKALDTGLSPGISRQRAYITFGIVSLALIMSQINGTIVTVGLPAITENLQTNLAYAGWVITGYQFSYCVTMPIIGRLSDEWGRKRIFLLAVIIFTLSSIACGFAPNIFWMIVFRFIQGIGGGAFMPSATGIVSDIFIRRRATALGLFTSAFSIGGIIGPNLGGILIDQFSWRWIFFVNVPIGIALILGVILILPKSKTTTNTHQRIDMQGVGLFSAAILAITYGMTDWADHPGGFQVLTGILFVAGVIFMVLFVRHENKTKQPMIDLTLLRKRSFFAANVYNFFYGGTIIGLFAFIPYYAQITYHMTATEAGILLTPRSIALIVASILTSFFILRLRYRLPMIVGLVIIAAGLILLSRGYNDINILGWDFQNLLLLTLIVFITGIGAGISNPAANNAMIDMFPEKAAAIAGIRGMFRVMGGVVATPIIVLVLSRFQDEGLGFQQISLCFAILLIVLIPVVFLVPEMARGKKESKVVQTANVKSIS
jgi:EmrB/QacA subfamily drug resistance transporter